MADQRMPPFRAISGTRQESGRTARHADLGADAIRGSGRCGFVAPGGSGSGELMAAIERRITERGHAALRVTGHRLEMSYPLGGLDDVLGLDDALDPGTRRNDEQHDIDPALERRCRDRLLESLAARGEGSTLLVDDAQWLDEATLRVLVGVIERAEDRGVSVIVAHRPATDNPHLTALDAAMSRNQPLVWLHPLDEQEVSERVALILGHAADPAMVEAIHEHSAGVQDLVDQLVLAWDARPPEAPHPGNAGLIREWLESAVIDAVRIEVDLLPPTARTVLTALSAGADLDDDLLGSITDLDRGELAAALDVLRSAGLLVAQTDEVVPVVAAAVLELTSVTERRRFHAALADALRHRHAPPTRAAEHFAAAGAGGKEAADAYIAAGEACLADAPELARTWFDRATAAGTSDREIASRRAEAEALDGDAEVALRLADAALGDSATPDRLRALGVMAALLPGRGFWSRSAAAYDELGRNGSETAQLFGVIGAVVSGTTADLERVARPPTGAPLEVEALALTARGLIASVSDGAGDAEAPFLESAALLESAHRSLLLPDSPHAIGASVALAMCHLSAAEHLLTRALERDIGGRALRLRHQLLLGWVAVRRGHWSAAERTLQETRHESLAPREGLLAAAIDAGLARRGGDLTRLGAAWSRAESLLLNHPTDLLSMDPIGELAVAASRLGLWDQISGKARELGDTLRTLGEPPLWVLPLRWVGLQVALAADDHEAVTRRAAEVAAVAPVHPRLGALAEAAGVWVRIMDGDVQPEQVTAAAKALQELSLTWEASRLTGQAAIRSTDPSVTRSLLEQARDLKSALPAAEADQAPTTTSMLSEREQVVAQHIVDGMTYKEIGAQLYISPKTVEHHVAKIRQKLGATTRAEMLASLRNHLG